MRYLNHPFEIHVAYSSAMRLKGNIGRRILLRLLRLALVGKKIENDPIR
jgi:hypothetical protein